KYGREFNAVFVQMPTEIKAGTINEIKVRYHGTPVEAKRPPWDGGFTWTHDDNGKLWVGVSCEGMGASSWWPCKDYLGDEPDSMRIICTVPNGLKVVSNGVEEKEVQHFDTSYSYPFNPVSLQDKQDTALYPVTTFYWKVGYCINT